MQPFERSCERSRAFAFLRHREEGSFGTTAQQLTHPHLLGLLGVPPEPFLTLLACYSERSASETPNRPARTAGKNAPTNEMVSAMATKAKSHGAVGSTMMLLG